MIFTNGVSRPFRVAWRTKVGANMHSPNVTFQDNRTQISQHDTEDPVLSVGMLSSETF